MNYSGAFPYCYDSVNSAYYNGYAEFLDRLFKSNKDLLIREVLDLGCGTGGITALMAGKGYDMIGADVSPDMLALAGARENNGVLYLCQDMRGLELYGTVQAVYSSFDCLNYILKTEELKKVFSLLRNYIEPGGLLVFDVNTLYRYEQVFGENCFVYELADDMLVWRNYYDKKNGLCEFALTFFKRQNGKYSREDENQTQRYYSADELTSVLKSCGFTDIRVCGGYDLSPAAVTSEKMYFIARR